MENQKCFLCLDFCGEEDLRSCNEETWKKILTLANYVTRSGIVSDSIFSKDVSQFFVCGECQQTLETFWNRLKQFEIAKLKVDSCVREIHDVMVTGTKFDSGVRLETSPLRSYIINEGGRMLKESQPTVRIHRLRFRTSGFTSDPLSPSSAPICTVQVHEAGRVSGCGSGGSLSSTPVRSIQEVQDTDQDRSNETTHNGAIQTRILPSDAEGNHRQWVCDNVGEVQEELEDSEPSIFVENVFSTATTSLPQSSPFNELANKPHQRLASNQRKGRIRKLVGLPSHPMKKRLKPVPSDSRSKTILESDNHLNSSGLPPSNQQSRLGKGKVNHDQQEMNHENLSVSEVLKNCPPVIAVDMIKLQDGRWGRDLYCILCQSRIKGWSTLHVRRVHGISSNKTDRHRAFPKAMRDRIREYLGLEKLELSQIISSNKRGKPGKQRGSDDLTSLVPVNENQVLESQNVDMFETMDGRTECEIGKVEVNIE